MTKKWKQDISICPLNKRIHFLLSLNNQLYECIGTLTLNPYTASVVRGDCIEGSPTIFYNGAIVGWAEYVTNEEAEAMI